MIKVNKSVFVILGATLLMSACGGNKEEQVVDVQTTTDTLSQDVRGDMTILRGSIPSPSDLTSVLSKAGYNYNKNSMNSTSKASSYSSKFQQAANLGGYGACLGYATAYKQNQDVIDYMAQMSKLAKSIGIDSAFDPEFMKAVSENIGKEDTVRRLIDRAYDKAERNLRSNDRVEVTTLVVAGGWVEGLYIASDIIGGKPKDDKNAIAYDQIYSHINALPYVIDFLSHFPKNQDCINLSKELKELRDIIDPLAKTKDFNQENVAKIKEAITPLRNKIVS
ncbi:MAG: hypothetical protein J0M08_13010 [Bacteroidetes bacterium]|nr:hypothetical protein [Bacteroidota bacterium]